MVVVEVSFGGVVSLVGDLVQLEHEGEVSHPPHLHLWRLGRVSVNSEETPSATEQNIFVTARKEVGHHFSCRLKYFNGILCRCLHVTSERLKMPLMKMVMLTVCVNEP